MHDTLPPRLSILVGKGGVGRSTLSAALGIVSARRGLRTTIVELATHPVIPGLFGVAAAGYSPVALLPGLSSLRITWEEALREYGLMKLRFLAMFRLVFDNPFMRHLLPAIPGVAEILVMGKVIHLASTQGRGAEAEHVILDGPATGHAISLLRAPTVVARSFAAGPLAEDAARLRDFLRDPARSRVHLVATPEEMPVSEALELHERLTVDAGMPMGEVFLNGMVLSGLDPSSRSAIRHVASSRHGEKSLAAAACAALFLSERHDAQRVHLVRLRRDGGEPVVPLPSVPEGAVPRMRLEVLADHLDAVLWREGR